MKRLIAALTLTLVLAGCSVSTGPNPLGLNNKAEPQTYDCSGDDTTFNEPGVTYVVNGRCGVVTVEGEGISVGIARAERINIRGDDNEVTAGIVGSVLINGQGNEVDAGGDDTITAVEIAGDGNRVSAVTMIESVVVNGNDNLTESQNGIGTVADNGTGNSTD
ncbi:DUF3060 domain-containing protein [Glaciihabitans arcticus]|uniref:DUF3060 domain-containing protein n=1 Tax=Glaciihabitans arcticus TaxID=2668039 RepID=A0A4Q9GSD6_9MICO|nr:membrane lipoprotein lipid attachment site-containing protein [Glaciihabitans arcticus]TBN57495.1 DUF3060 domain-containing protein [Glaciihabitans arcticus]